MIGRAWSRLPLLVRFMLSHAASGVAVGWAFLLAILWLDVSGLGTRLAASPDGGLATAVLAVLFAITFGAVGIGIAVINLPWDRR